MENNNLAYISIIAIVAVVGIIGLIMMVGGSKATTPGMDFSIGGENLAGDAKTTMDWASAGYNQYWDETICCYGADNWCTMVSGQGCPDQACIDTGTGDIDLSGPCPEGSSANMVSEDITAIIPRRLAVKFTV